MKPYRAGARACPHGGSLDLRGPCTRPAGRRLLFTWLILDELHSTNLAVRRNWRRRGAARAMLGGVLDTAERAGATVPLWTFDGPTSRPGGCTGVLASRWRGPDPTTTPSLARMR